MAYVDEELASQPDCWRTAAALAPEHAAVLGRPGERVAVTGCGTSWFMAMAYATLRERAGLGETDAFQSSEFPINRRYDRVVAITRSGTTTEVTDLLAALPGTPSTVIVGDGATPAARLATDVVAMPFADERSVVQTRFATSALALLRAHLGEDLSDAVTDAEVAVRTPLPVDPALVEQITFLGRGWTVGLAQEAALKCREAANFWSEAYPAMDYRHGPIAIAAPHRVVWAFGEVPAGLDETVAATGATFVHSSGHCGHTALGSWNGGRVPLDPMADLILAQRFAVALAAGRHLDPDAPRNLTRSVVLT
ncbi:SIS domain-containing protein [Catenuloplanes atrovinosus]|uniref:Fructoselysine-6-P-deglycase FrlB-like protein n=1 Tax=Catenuloplanes atrovinosus TaxID=137266 RepID=A0AAE4CD88_9ACTN|nr:sugar isomerase [Catenuloplanes atrovinosus]MDR7280376.1 fructoselysine-6-P-deglycase FrlB-like protein [Catenuloplanes atrovinosus]